jgi:dienelactone hydrolase
VLVTAPGAGIAIRYVTKTGLSWTSILGWLTLVAGLALLAYSGVVSWRGLHRWQRLWLLPITVVALAVMWPVAMGTMLAYAPRTGLGSATPADRGLNYTSVEFRTGDGVRLSAWYIPSNNSAAVVMVPGAGSNRTATLGQATVVARHGYGVLMVDPRGQGRSGGQAMDAGWYGDRDVTAAVGFLQRQPGVDPTRIGVLGLSMGGEEAIGAAAADPAIGAVVAEGATHRTAADKSGYLPGGIAGAIQRGLDLLTYSTAALLSRAPQPATLHGAIVRARSTPFLLIAAGEGIDEPEAVAFLRDAAPGRVQTWTVPGATHVHGLATSPAEWTARVTTFLDRALGKAGSP